MVQDRNAGRSKTPVKQALLKGVYGVLTNTLLARFGTYHALLFLQSKAPDVAKVGMLGLVQAACILTCQQRARQFHHHAGSCPAQGQGQPGTLSPPASHSSQ
jgi:hypothetical protein